MGGLMFFYQNVVSKEIAGSGCPYSPSCSDFSKQSIEQFGLIKGIALSADRFSRCTNAALIEMQYVKTENGTGRYINAPAEYKFHSHK